MTNAALVIEAPARQLELLMANLHTLKGEIEQLRADIGEVLSAALATPETDKAIATTTGR